MMLTSLEINANIAPTPAAARGAINCVSAPSLAPSPAGRIMMAKPIAHARLKTEINTIKSTSIPIPDNNN